MKVYPDWSLQNEGYTAVQLWAGLPAQGDRGEKGRLVLQDCLHCLIEITRPRISFLILGKLTHMDELKQIYLPYCSVTDR